MAIHKLKENLIRSRALRCRREIWIKMPFRLWSGDNYYHPKCVSHFIHSGGEIIMCVPEASPFNSPNSPHLPFVPAFSIRELNKINMCRHSNSICSPPVCCLHSGWFSFFFPAQNTKCIHPSFVRQAEQWRPCWAVEQMAKMAKREITQCRMVKWMADAGSWGFRLSPYNVVVQKVELGVAAVPSFHFN